MGTGTAVQAVPKPIEVGPEMEALRRFCPDVTWSGTIREGGMGPGTPAMPSVGRGTHEVSRTVVGSSAPTRRISS